MRSSFRLSLFSLVVAGLACSTGSASDSNESNLLNDAGATAADGSTTLDANSTIDDATVSENDAAALSDSGAPLVIPTVASSPVGFLTIPSRVPPYEYGPSIVLENGRYYNFFCSPSDTPPHPYDAIRLTESDNGVDWTAPVSVLAAGGAYGAASVCDPSVVKFRGVYYMYHTCINPGPPDDPAPPDGYGNNRICVAVADSIKGPYRRLDKPIIQDLTCPSKIMSYCVGQPAAVVVDDEVYVYYTNHRPGDPDPSPGNIFVQSSKDGFTFGPIKNDGKPIWNRRNVDVKRDRRSGLFFMVQAEVDVQKVSWAVSNDGVHFSPYDATRYLEGNPALPAGGTNHNPGIASDAEGYFTGTSFVVYGSNYLTGVGIDWHMYRSNFTLNPKENDCTACAPNSCDWLCSTTVKTNQVGTCVVPGSSDSGKCCACAPAVEKPDCKGCSAACGTACVGAGYSVGVCAAPGSTNPSSCCGCY